MKLFQTADSLYNGTKTAPRLITLTTYSFPYKQITADTFIYFNAFIHFNCGEL